MINISVEQILDDETFEAAISVSDGNTSFVCFSCPYTTNYDKGKAYIYAFGTKNIVVACDNANTYKRSDDYWSYHIKAQIIDAKNRIVNIGNLYIVLDADIPGDISNGTDIEFDVCRLDFLDGKYIVL